MIDGVVRALLGVFDDLRLSIFDNGDARVGRAQVNADNFCHDVPFRYKF